MIGYKQKRLIGGELIWVIVDEIGKITNRSPSKEELRCLETFPEKDGRSRPRLKITKEQILEYFRTFYEDKRRVPGCKEFDDNPKYPNHKIVANYFGSWNNAIRDAGLWKKRYNPTHTCDRCGKGFEEVEKSGRYSLQECDGQGNWTGNWDCPDCYQKYDPNSTNNTMKRLRNCRTGSQDPNHECTKGDRTIDLACELYGYANLNKKYDNYNTEIDCQDEKTGLLYQIQGRQYNPRYEWWCFTRFDREQYKDYKDMICFCKSKDGKTIERIYRFPSDVIKGIKTITIVKNPSRGVQWYEEYRIKDPEELKRANDICQRILKKIN